MFPLGTTPANPASRARDPMTNSKPKKGVFVVAGAALSALLRVLLFNSFDEELNCLGVPIPFAAGWTVQARPSPMHPA
jgi:hypothetical protein